MASPVCTTPAMPCRCQPKTLPTEEYRNGYSIAGCCEGVKGQRTSSSHPHLHGAIKTARGDILAIGRPGDGIHGVGMAVIGVHVATIAGIPHLYVLSSCQRQCAAHPATKRQHYAAGMAAKEVQIPTIAGIPHLHRLISSCQRQCASHRATRPPTTQRRNGRDRCTYYPQCWHPTPAPSYPNCQTRHACHRATRPQHPHVGMAAIGVHVAPVSHPILHRLVSTRGGDALAIGRPGDGNHLSKCPDKCIEGFQVQEGPNGSVPARNLLQPQPSPPDFHHR